MNNLYQGILGGAAFSIFITIHAGLYIVEDRCLTGEPFEVGGVEYRCVRSG